MARIKLLRNKREIQVKQMRKEISQLLTTGQEPSARIRVRISVPLFSPFTHYCPFKGSIIAVQWRVVELQLGISMSIR